MSDTFLYGFAFLVLAGLCAFGFWFAQQNRGLGGITLFNARQRRLGLVEAASVDGRRRLILVRRDNVEHLILTGGPVDVLIETGIAATPRPVVLGLDQSNGKALSSMEPLNEEVPLALPREQAN